jgi:putative ABC transport system permease protein
MGRLAWSQLRFRTVRLIALLLGMLLATTAFTVLTAASRTSQLRTVGTVSAHFVPAYDILVRPKNSRTALETKTGTVQPNFLSGLYGGITMSQYHQIAAIPGVDVAAPVAMVGYSLLWSFFSYSLPASAYSRPGRQLYRVSTTWVSDGGRTRITQPGSYVYVTPRPIQWNDTSGQTRELLPGGKSANICSTLLITPQENPFSPAAQAGADPGCASTVNGAGAGSGDTRPANPGYQVTWVMPMLIAAVDPAAEAKLDGLSHALVSGTYLGEKAGARQFGGAGGDGADAFPVLAAASTGTGEVAESQLQELPEPASPPSMNAPWVTAEAAVPGRTIATVRTTAQQAYQHLLTELAGTKGHYPVNGYWSVSSTTYQRTAAGALTPQLVQNQPRAFYSGPGSAISMDNEESQYRKLVVHAPQADAFTGDVASPHLVGTFNPAKVTSFDPLSAVPLGLYQPTAAVPANAASRASLRGQDLLPNQNLGGYVSQPVNLITTLSALPALQNAGYYGTGLDASDPISVIRVRVAGVTGPNGVSLARIRQVAQQIEQDTRLDVDIVAGSSPAPTTISLPAGKYGQPALTLSENWVKKGVAMAILTAVDKDSVVLFGLILIVCVLFVANSASAAVRGRRRELGILAALGWTRPRLFAAVLGELAAIGLTSGVLGALAALPLSSALGLHASPGRAALAVPVAVAVAVIAGLIPAGLAASAEPAESVRPPVLGVRRGHQPGGVTGLAAVNVLRTPGRALVGAISLAVGVTALTLLTAMTFAFRGVIVGSLLGDAVAVQVRGVDYVAVIATVALGVLAVADVIFLNITERAPELAAIRTFGWRESALSRLVITEGAIIGLGGSLAGAAIGLAAAADFAGQLPGRLFLIAAVAVAGGVLITAAAAFLPARALRRLPAAHLLAEE